MQITQGRRSPELPPRANALATYRFWHDISYAAGALAAGILADALGLNATVIAASGLLAARWITDLPTH